MALRATYLGTDNIMNGYDDFIVDAPYWSVWNQKFMLGQYAGEDVVEGRTRLENLVDAAAGANNTDVFIIKFHAEKKGKFVDQNAVVAAMVCKAADPTADGFIGTTGVIPSAAYNGLASRLSQEMKALFDAQNKRLEALETETAEPDMIDRISGILEKPGMMDLVGKLLGPVIGRVVGLIPNPHPANPQEPPPVAPRALSIAGIPPEPANEQEALDRLNAALERLAPNMDLVTDLELLAGYAEKNPVMFKGLLDTLRQTA
jgi:hypothetical protein